MLVVSRLVDESIILTVPPSAEERTIKVMVTSIRNKDCVRLGVHAERDIAVHRDDALEKLKAR